MQATGQTYNYTIATEVPPGFMGKLMNSIYHNFIAPQESHFKNVKLKTDEGNDVSLAFTIITLKNRPSVSAEIRGGNPIRLTVNKLYEGTTDEWIEKLRQDISINISLFEERLRRGTIFFAWREGEKIVPEKVKGRESSLSNRIFFETQVLLFLIFIVLAIVLYPIVGFYTPLLFLAIQLIFVLYSNKIIARGADWRITESNPDIHILEYHLPYEEQADFKNKIPKDRLVELKKEIYDQTIAKNGEIDCTTSGQIFNHSGLECSLNSLTSKKVNVFGLVRKAAEKFGFPMPTVVVANTEMPNAAASGPSPSRGVVLITTGLLVQLDEDEILSVLGHEFGHLKGRDPLLLFGITSIQYLVLFYILLPLISFSFLLYFVSFWALLGITYFIAKFFEARADLVSAMVVGQPKILAEALEKIGFKMLINERMSGSTAAEWLSFDPHPPIYFRIARLEKINNPYEIKHPFVQSAREVIRGFIGSL